MAPPRLSVTFSGVRAVIPGRPKKTLSGHPRGVLGAIRRPTPPSGLLPQSFVRPSLLFSSCRIAGRSPSVLPEDNVEEGPHVVRLVCRACLLRRPLRSLWAHRQNNQLGPAEPLRGRCVGEGRGEEDALHRLRETGSKDRSDPFLAFRRRCPRCEGFDEEECHRSCEVDGQMCVAR